MFSGMKETWRLGLDWLSGIRTDLWAPLPVRLSGPPAHMMILTSCPHQSSPG